MAKRLKFKAVFTNKISSEKALPRHIGGKVENIFGIAFCRKFLFPRQKALFQKRFINRAPARFAVHGISPANANIGI